MQAISIFKVAHIQIYATEKNQLRKLKSFTKIVSLKDRFIRDIPHY